MCLTAGPPGEAHQVQQHNPGSDGRRSLHEMLEMQILAGARPEIWQPKIFWHHGVGATTKLRQPNLICGVQLAASTASVPSRS